MLKYKIPKLVTRRKLGRICNPADITKRFAVGMQETIREWFLRLVFCNYMVLFSLGTLNFRHFK